MTGLTWILGLLMALPIFKRSTTQSIAAEDNEKKAWGSAISHPLQQNELLLNQIKVRH